jgi:hypothetical protein
MQDFERTVAQRLSAPGADESLFLGRHVAARPLEPFDTFMEEGRLRIQQSLRQEFGDVDAPPRPHLRTIRSWNECFTDGRARTEAERAADRALFFVAQSWGAERVSAARWRACLACFDRPAQWLELALRIDEEGRIIEAAAALAAARWLDPEGTRDAIARHRGSWAEGLPEAVFAQPDPTFRACSAQERHWRAWDMKNHGLSDLPSLLAFESDENFSVRARVYRSLGQCPHPVSIQALHEGCLDPHPFARAQAIRSLGWCADPTTTGDLARVAVDDPDPFVRRAAEQARQRIVGYWRHFGDWEQLMADAATGRSTAASLIDQGMPHLATDVLTRTGNLDVIRTPALAPIFAALWPEELRKAPERRYTHWSASAKQEEADARGATESDHELAALMEGADEAPSLRALRVVSLQGRHALRPEVEALTERPGPVGWGARRVMRSMGWSLPAQ